MQSDIFFIDDKGIVNLRKESLAIPEIKSYIDSRTKNKDIIEKEVQYIWHSISTKSPYEGYSQDRREKQIIRDFIKDGSWKPDVHVQALLNLYKNLSDSPAKRLLNAARTAVDELATYIANPETDTEVKAKLMEKIPKIVEGLDKCEERVKKEIATEEKIRGGGSSKLRER